MKPRTLVLVYLVVLLAILPFRSAQGDALDNWTPTAVNTNGIGPFKPQFLGLAYGNGRYVAVGQYISTDYAVVQTSDEGMTWTDRDPVSVYDLFDVTYANGKFVAVGWDWWTGANIYDSTNGINWTSQTQTNNANFYRVTFGSGLFVAVGDGELLQSSNRTNRQIYTSANGTSWTGRLSGAPSGDVHTLRDVAYGAGRFVAVDDAGYVHTSTTGTTWTRNLVGAGGGGYGGYVSFCNDRFIALFNNGTNFVSTDGLSWSPMVKDTTNLLSRVIYANGAYIAVAGPYLSSTNVTLTNIFTSANGTNWLRRNFAAPTNASLESLVFANGRVMAAGWYIIGSGMLYPNYVPLAYVSDPFAAVSIGSGFPPQLQISGLLGRSYRIDFTSSLQAPTNNWQPLATISLTNSPFYWLDTSATNSQRYYRTVLLP